MDSERRQAFDDLHSHIEQVNVRITDLENRVASLEKWKDDHSKWTNNGLRDVVRSAMRESFAELHREQNILYLKAFGRKTWGVVTILGIAAAGAAVAEFVKALL